MANPEFWNADGSPNDSMLELMETPPRPPVDAWFKSKVRWQSKGCDVAWRHLSLQLRVVRDAADGRYYAAPYGVTVFRERYMELRVGPYVELREALLAAEMLGRIGG